MRYLGKLKDPKDLVTKEYVDYNIKNGTTANAEQLITDQTIAIDQTPYLFRRSANGVAIGNRENDKIVGGTLAWNQMVQNGNFADGTTNWQTSSSSISATAGKLTMTTTGVGAVYQTLLNTFVVGHKYYWSATITTDSTEVRIGVHNSATAVSSMCVTSDYSSGKTDVRGVFNNDTTIATPNFRVRNNTGIATTTVIENVILIDLTLMFGTAIADHAYALETATPGSGIAWLKSYGFFAKPYYPYNAGELISVKPSAHKMVGFNQWDEEWEPGSINSNTGENQETGTIRSKNYIPVKPGMHIYGYSGSTTTVGGCRYYAKDKSYIGQWDAGGNTGIFGVERVVPDNCYFIRWNAPTAYPATYQHDICINLSDPDKNGSYEPYTANLYPLDTSTEWRGLFKMDADGNLYADGDTYKADGSVTRKYGKVDLGTLTWAYTGGAFYTTAIASTVQKPASTSVLGNYICNYLTQKASADAWATYQFNVGSNGNLWAKTDGSSNDPAVFKAALAAANAVLVYELATPTTETADPFQTPQIVSADGTEQYIDDRTVAIPVGHSTDYMADLVGKLENLPSMDSADLAEINRRILASFPTDTASGSVVSIPDGADNIPVKAMTVQIESVQDLHGYDSPWPAGGGVNIFASAPAETKTLNDITIVSDGMGKYTISGTASSYGSIDFDLINEFTIPNSIGFGGNGCLYLNNSFTAANNVFVPIFLYNDTVADSWTLSEVNRKSASYSTMGGKQCNRIRFQFYAGASISGTIAPMISDDGSTNLDFMPYSNLCPISGWTGANIPWTGANLMAVPMAALTSSSTWTPTGFMLKAGTYFLAFSVSTATSWRLGIKVYDAKGNAVGNDANYKPICSTALSWNSARQIWGLGANTTGTTYEISFPQDCQVAFCLWSGDVSASTTLSNVMLNVGSTAQPYAPYNGASYTVTWTDEGTVYGGMADYIGGGQWRVTPTMASVDLGTLTWERVTQTENTYMFSTFSNTDVKKAQPNSGYCSMYKFNGQVEWTALADKEIAYRASLIRIRDDAYTTAAAFTTAVSGQMLVYELATPGTPFIVEGPDPTTLLGDNNVWADCGPVAVQYRADTSLYIQKLISNL